MRPNDGRHGWTPDKGVAAACGGVVDSEGSHSGREVHGNKEAGNALACTHPCLSHEAPASRPKKGYANLTLPGRGRAKRSSSSALGRGNDAWTQQPAEFNRRHGNDMPFGTQDGIAIGSNGSKRPMYRPAFSAPSGRSPRCNAPQAHPCRPDRRQTSPWSEPRPMLVPLPYCVRSLTKTKFLLRNSQLGQVAFSRIAIGGTAFSRTALSGIGIGGVPFTRMAISEAAVSGIAISGIAINCVGSRSTTDGLPVLRRSSSGQS